MENNIETRLRRLEHSHRVIVILVVESFIYIVIGCIVSLISIYDPLMAINVLAFTWPMSVMILITFVGFIMWLVFKDDM